MIPIADRHLPPAEELAGVLRARGLRVDVDGSDNRMQNKIRLAQEQKIPYMLVLGDREIEARTAAPRTRAGEQQPAEEWSALAERLAGESAARGVVVAGRLVWRVLGALAMPAMPARPCGHDGHAWPMPGGPRSARGSSKTRFQATAQRWPRSFDGQNAPAERSARRKAAA